MFDVDLLVLVNGTRNFAMAEDTARAAVWACGPSAQVVLVDARRAYPTQPTLDYSLMRAVEGVPAKWAPLSVLQTLVEGDAVFRAVLLLEDNTLCLRPQLGPWIVDSGSRQDVGILGVGRSQNSGPAFQQATQLFYNWGIEHQHWETPPPAFCNNLLVLSKAYVGLLFQKGLLYPDGHDEWANDLGMYLSWLSPMLGLSSIMWGYQHKHLPPLYVADGSTGYLPAPQVLLEMTMAYSPINQVPGYAEHDLREIYKRQRGEPHQPIASFGALVTAGPIQ